jgi:hypothetical protein
LDASTAIEDTTRGRTPWLLLIAGWFVDFPTVRYAGLVLLSISFLNEKLSVHPGSSSPILVFGRG